ncbi:MAG: ADP-ribosylglycohydrolase family protein [Gordonia sp. (in: high G+C Gram-positive bacteria)]
MSTLTSAQSARAFGAVLGSAVGDALGVPYEFGRPLRDDEFPEMIGGGLGDYAPGEWSDDTSMAMAITEVAATGVRLTSDDALDAVAAGFLRWYTDFDGNPPDIGNQTRAVLRATHRRTRREPDARVGALMREESAIFAAAHPHSAGNGALMRTAPVALAHLDDRDGLARAARAIAALTHADPLAGDSCVLWSEAIRVAIIDGRIDLLGGLDLLPAERREQWHAWLDAAATEHPKSFHPNGYTVTALQAAAASILQTPAHPDGRHAPQALAAAIRIGDDTDTVAAIAGGLLGAAWGPGPLLAYRDQVHGWPVTGTTPTTADDLERLVTAVLSAPVSFDEFRGSRPREPGPHPIV